MPRTIKIPAAAIFDFADQAFSKGQAVRITVTGSSMQPFLRPHIDSVELIQADFTTIRPWDIVLFRRRRGEYVLHRLYRKHQDNCYFIGDAQTFIEGPIKPDQIIAQVKTIWRGPKCISASDPVFRLAAMVWTHTIFPRKVLNFFRRRFPISRKCQGKLNH